RGGAEVASVQHARFGRRGQVDFWLLTSGPFEQSRFTRKRKEEAFGMSISVSAPEDTIFAKLRWTEVMGGRPKQMLDVKRVGGKRGARRGLPPTSSGGCRSGASPTSGRRGRPRSTRGERDMVTRIIRVAWCLLAAPAVSPAGDKKPSEERDWNRLFDGKTLD